MGHSVYIKVYFFAKKDFVVDKKTFERFEDENSKWFKTFDVELKDCPIKTKKYSVVNSAHIFSDGSNVFAHITKDIVVDDILPVCKTWVDDVNQMNKAEKCGLIVLFSDENDRDHYETCVVKIYLDTFYFS